MAKSPTIIIYSPNNGAANTVYNTAANIGVSTLAASEKGIGGINLSTAQTANTWIQYHYTADTGW
jgi:hypothetical protein